MFWQMIKGAFTRQTGKFAAIALAVALGSAIATAMLNTMFDVGDKVNKELKAYGANITVRPKFASILSDMYNDESEEGFEFLSESDALRIKTIFWAHNIVDFAPFLFASVEVNGEEFRLAGTWFNKESDLPTGERVTTGVIGLKSWWHIDGEWPSDDDASAVMLGSEAAKRLNKALGDEIEINGRKYAIKAAFSAGGEEDEFIVTALAAAQHIAGAIGKISQIDLSALTIPENDLARKAAQDPASLTLDEWETWYCTAYISSIAYQIEEALPNARAKAVLQISQSEGAILKKIQSLMALLTALTLVCSALGVSSLVTTCVMEKTAEIGLLKAIGALDAQVALITLTQVAIASAVGASIGCIAGLNLASVIGRTVFDANVEPNVLTIPIAAALALLTALIGSVPAIKLLLATRPAVALHG
ncbi:MAG: ABC transporter permease [Helicobacteraceae bacterium]|jgi:putative ABC transport system permease protein|nr:ABC transporter permease [Helicobacteraceae bacterium]